MSHAPTHLRLEWLLKSLHETRELVRSKRTDALGVMANPPDSQFPAVTRAKVKARASVYAEWEMRLDWLLSRRRPWNKPQTNPAPEDL